MPPSHRMRGVTAVLVRHKPQWHRHDRRSSAVVPSLIAVAPPKPRTFAVARRKLLTCSAVPPQYYPRHTEGAVPLRPCSHLFRFAFRSRSGPGPLVRVAFTPAKIDRTRSGFGPVTRSHLFRSRSGTRTVSIIYIPGC